MANIKVMLNGTEYVFDNSKLADAYAALGNKLTKLAGEPGTGGGNGGSGDNGGGSEPDVATFSISMYTNEDGTESMVIDGIPEGATWRELAEIHFDVYVNDYTPGDYSVDGCVEIYTPSGMTMYVRDQETMSWAQPDDAIRADVDAYFAIDYSPTM